ncbi:MAG: SH3 domain-containing protein [Alphaproteobacteria bacterium]|nr:SH3 domain-containing protein [Alphaproteobacteria bacterium]
MARPVFSALVVLSCVAVAAGGLFVAFGRTHHQADPEITGSTTAAPAQLGQSGLPVPRFVSLKTEKVNVRTGPSSDHDVAFVYQQKGLPVEIIAEFETWRRVRDSEGTEGWILKNMLASKRYVLIAPWKKNELTPLYASRSLQSGWLANLAPGAFGEIATCDGQWCDVKINGFRGFVQQEKLWGAYPGEVVN